MCLTCSGVHRGLGVHISFVRSITMDAFKSAELLRMKAGGNKPWKDFFNAHSTNKLEGRTFDDCTIQERYDSEAGEEWKERLTAKVEGKEYVPQEREKKVVPKRTGVTPSQSRSQTPLDKTRAGNSLQPSRSQSPSLGASALNSTNAAHAQRPTKTQNEAYFAKMGAANADRSADLPPSQGGKFAGFGSEPVPQRQDNGALPGVDDFQKDPMAALTKGFGWLSSNVTKGAQTGYSGWVKPGIQKVSPYCPRYRAVVKGHEC